MMYNLYMFLSNNPSSGVINLSNLSCFTLQNGDYDLIKILNLESIQSHWRQSKSTMSC